MRERGPFLHVVEAAYVVVRAICRPPVRPVKTRSEGGHSPSDEPFETINVPAMKSLQAESAGVLLVEAGGLERIDCLMRDESLGKWFAAVLEKQRSYCKLVERPPSSHRRIGKARLQEREHFICNRAGPSMKPNQHVRSRSGVAEYWAANWPPSSRVIVSIIARPDSPLRQRRHWWC